MGYILIACITCIWLAISAAIYTGLWSGFMYKSGNTGLWLWNLGASLILSPGAIVGHGILPFPGGLVMLLADYSLGNNSILIFNFALWMITFLLFFILSWAFKNDKL
jgi:hypothetical protein